MTKQPWQEDLDKARDHTAKAIELVQNKIDEDGYDLMSLSVYVNLYNVHELGKRNPSYIVECIDLDMNVS